jgi:hypothetical protein
VYPPAETRIPLAALGWTAAHQFGWLEPRIYGRVDIAVSDRGILEGDISLECIPANDPGRARSERI